MEIPSVVVRKVPANDVDDPPRTLVNNRAWVAGCFIPCIPDNDGIRPGRTIVGGPFNNKINVSAVPAVIFTALAKSE